MVDNLPRVTSSYRPAVTGGVAAAGRTVTCIYGAGLVVGREAGFSIRVSVVNGARLRLWSTPLVVPDRGHRPGSNKATDRVRSSAKQTADKLPPDPSVLPARKTEQGQKIRTKVRCRTLKSSAAGEVSFCKITRKKNRTVKVKVVGNRPVKVTVIQRARHEELQGLQAGEDHHRAARSVLHWLAGSRSRPVSQFGQPATCRIHAAVPFSAA